LAFGKGQQELLEKQLTKLQKEAEEKSALLSQYQNGKVDREKCECLNKTPQIFHPGTKKRYAIFLFSFPF